MRDKQQIADLCLAQHYRIVATKNIWYNRQWYDACTRLCIMASNINAEIRRVKEDICFINGNAAGSADANSRESVAIQDSAPSITLSQGG